MFILAHCVQLYATTVTEVTGTASMTRKLIVKSGAMAVWESLHDAVERGKTMA